VPYDYRASGAGAGARVVLSLKKHYGFVWYPRSVENRYLHPYKLTLAKPSLDFVKCLIASVG
jgi:hypothetical protein